MEREDLEMEQDVVVREVINVRTLALLDAAKSVCGYCAGADGHEKTPVKMDRWLHMFLVGNGANPCSAGPIWELIAECQKSGPRYGEVDRRLWPSGPRH